MKQRPPRPKAYCLPSMIELKPVKRKFQKPYWHVKTDKIGVCVCRTKAEAYAYLDRRMKKVFMDDQELYETLLNLHWDVLRYPTHFRKDRDGQTYTATDDKHDWRFADEVELLLWFHENGFERGAK